MGTSQKLIAAALALAILADGAYPLARAQEASRDTPRRAKPGAR